MARAEQLASRRAPFELSDQDAVSRMFSEFISWDIEVEPEGFMHRMRVLHKHWILSRFDNKIREPKEKWRYLVATCEGMLSGMREAKWQEVAEASGSEAKIRKALHELENFDRKMKLWHIAQQSEQGETNLKVHQGLLPGEAYEMPVRRNQAVL